jgi:hypothetical protein
VSDESAFTVSFGKTEAHGECIAAPITAEVDWKNLEQQFKDLGEDTTDMSPTPFFDLRISYVTKDEKTYNAGTGEGCMDAFMELGEKANVAVEIYTPTKSATNYEIIQVPEATPLDDLARPSRPMQSFPPRRRNGTDLLSGCKPPWRRRAPSAGQSRAPTPTGPRPTAKASGSTAHSSRDGPTPIPAPASPNAPRPILSSYIGTTTTGPTPHAVRTAAGSNTANQANESLRGVWRRNGWLD